MRKPFGFPVQGLATMRTSLTTLSDSRSVLLLARATCVNQSPESMYSYNSKGDLRRLLQNWAAEVDSSVDRLFTADRLDPAEVVYAKVNREHHVAQSMFPVSILSTAVIQSRADMVSSTEFMQGSASESAYKTYERPVDVRAWGFDTNGYVTMLLRVDTRAFYRLFEASMHPQTYLRCRYVRGCEYMYCDPDGATSETVRQAQMGAERMSDRFNPNKLLDENVLIWLDEIRPLVSVLEPPPLPIDDTKKTLAIERLFGW